MSIHEDVELLRRIPMFAKVDPAKLKLLAFTSPNTQAIFRHYEPALEGVARGSRALAWPPGRAWSYAFVALFVACIFSMNRVSEFLYFQF